MLKRWMLSGCLVAAGGACLLSGCSMKPPMIVDAAEPGIDPRSTFIPKEDSPAEAVGEIGLHKDPKSDKKVETTIPPALPTVIGQTKTTPRGVVYETLVEGTGATAEAGQTISIHYTGKLESGKIFDSSRGRNRPYETVIGMGNVIGGWDEAVPGMKVGERRKLTIPPQLGYQAQGHPPDIPPNATLEFDVELMDIK